MPPSSSYFPLCPISCCSKSPKKKLAQDEEISIRINNKETLKVPAKSLTTLPKDSKKVVYSRSTASSLNIGISPPTAIDIETEDEFTTARTHGSDRRHLSMRDLLHNVRVEEGLSARSTQGENATDKRCSLPTIPEQAVSQSASDHSTNTPDDANNIDVEAIKSQEGKEQKKKRKAAVFNQHGDISARTVSSTNSQKESSRSDGMFDELPSFQVSSPAQASSAVQRYIIYPPQVSPSYLIKIRSKSFRQSFSQRFRKTDKKVLPKLL